MTGMCLKNVLRMAAPAAIFILLPGVAAAEVCDKGELFLSDYFPTLDQWIESSPQKDQLRQLLLPGTWITGALLIWLIVSNSVRPTVVTACWFGILALLAAVGYFSIDLNNPYYRAAISEGCVEHSPYRIFTNLGFAAVALVLTVQRMRRQNV